MKGVKHGSEVWMVDLLDQSASLRGRGQEITFKPIKILDSQLDVRLSRDLRGLSKHIGRPFLFVGRGTRT